MRIHYLQHAPFEGLGYIFDWANNGDHVLSKTALYANEPLPEASTFDFLVIMGGPMGVHDTAEYPWLKEEKQLINTCVLSGKKTLGICLGAQLIADSLGARISKNHHKEIGWHPVARTGGAQNTELKMLFPETFYAFHWHGDTFDLPDGAVHLAQSEACFNQAFFYPPATLGVQFHLESSKAGIELLVDHCGHELVAAPFIQNSAEIRSRSELIERSNTIMQGVLDFISGL